MNADNRKGARAIQTRRARERGVTLIELLIAMVIIGLLSAIAYPNYARYVLKSHRTAAKTALHDMASRQERLFTTTNQYGTTLAALGYPAGATVPIPDATSHYYDLSVAATNPAGGPSTYTLTAAPFGTQTNDLECVTFTLDQLGTQGMGGGGTATAQTCWK